MTTKLTSARYAVLGIYDRFSRHRVLVEEARRHKTVLECGCATGFLSRLISENGGPDLVGLEREPEAAQQARHYCRRVVVADLNDPDWTRRVGEHFDLVIFGDVLEHLVDPVTSLQAARRLLRPGGKVLICVPNIAHWSIRARLLAGRFDYQAAGILDITHLHFYTRKTAMTLIGEAGYHPLSFTPVFGGRFTTRARPLWNLVTRALPGLFANQMIFLVEPRGD